MSTAIANHGRADRLVAGFAALAISIHLLESAVPMPLPGVKPGLTNVVVLIVMLRYGFRMALAVALLRILAGSILIGTFLTPTFFLSLAGGMTSLAVAGALALPGTRWISVVGLAIAMSMAHIGAQFLFAWWLFVPHPALLNLLPILLAISMGLGLLTGIITARVLDRLANRNA